MKKTGKFLIILFFILALLVSICFVPIRVSVLIPRIEEQVQKDFGVNLHIERLILRLGPCLKLKAPKAYVFDKQGQKIAQFDTLKLYISWHALLKRHPDVKKFEAKNLILEFSSNNEEITDFINKIDKNLAKKAPNFHFKDYAFIYIDQDKNRKYTFKGHSLDLQKIKPWNSYKLKSKGNFSINGRDYIFIDIHLAPYLEITDFNFDFKILDLFEQIKDLDFHSDVIGDIKLYKNMDGLIQASGFLNIDNTSVFDSNNKCPKSYAYITLWGDKASILSNIFTAENRKILIEGMIKNSKKPTIDLKVKAEDININDLYKKLKIFTNFSSLKDIKSVDGLLNANFSLKGDLNKIKSNGYLKISEASIITDSLKVNKIHSDIDFTNNTINVQKAVGYVNDAPIILKGTVDKKVDLQILMNKVEMKHLCPAKWGVKSGITSLIANINGPLDKIVHYINLNIEDLKFSHKDTELAIKSFKLNTNKNNIGYIDNIICKAPYTEQIKIPSIKLIVDDNNIKMPMTNAFMPNSMIRIKGDFINYKKPEYNFVINSEGFLNTKDFKFSSNVSNSYPIKLNLTGNHIQKNINGQVLLEKTDVFNEPVLLNIISKIDKNTLKIEDLSLNSFSGEFVNDLKSNLKGSKKVIISGVIENLEEPIFKNLRIFIPQQLSINILQTVAQLKGDLFINGSYKKPEIVGQLSLFNLINQMLQLTISNFTIDFNKNDIITNCPMFKLADTILAINSLVSTNYQDSIVIKNINIKSKYINADTLLMYKDLTLTKKNPVKILDGKLFSEKILANIYGSQLNLSSFSSDIKLNDNILQLKNILSDLHNGKLSGSLDYNLRDEHFDSKIMARNVSAEPIFNIISNNKDTINGTLDFDADIKGELSSKQSLNGNIKFIVNNGHMATLGKLEHLLYAQNIIADNMLRTSLSVITKAITLKDTGLFKYLRGDVDLQNGIANIKMLQSQGPLMALYIKGLYNSMTDFANLIILGRLSNEVVSGLGAFGDFSFNKLMIMLTGEEQTLNIQAEDFEKIPQLPDRNTKEFRSIINGPIDKTTSVKSFNWISYSKKSLKQKEIPLEDAKLPAFIDTLKY